MIPKDLRYHQEHEWVRVSGTQATVGISHFAQDALGDIVFIDMPKLGAVVKAGQQIGEVESTKTTSTIYTPVSGTIAKINADLKDHPEVVNSDPYGKGWMVVVDLSNTGEVEKLMTAAGRIGRHGHWDATLVHGEFLFFHYRAAEAARFYLTRPKSFERPTNWFLTKCLVENISC